MGGQATSGVRGAHGVATMNVGMGNLRLNVTGRAGRRDGWLLLDVPLAERAGQSRVYRVSRDSLRIKRVGEACCDTRVA